MAQRPGGGTLRAASSPCRIGGLDFRTQGCVKHFIFPPDSLGLIEVRRSERVEGRGERGQLSLFTLLRSDTPFFRPGPDEQTYARHFTIRAFTARLLAIEPLASFDLQPGLDRPQFLGDFADTHSIRDTVNGPAPHC